MLNVDGKGRGEGKKKKINPSRIVCIPRPFAAFRFLQNMRGSEPFETHQMGG